MPKTFNDDDKTFFSLSLSRMVAILHTDTSRYHIDWKNLTVDAISN